MLYECEGEVEARAILAQAIAKEGKIWPVEQSELVEKRTIKHLMDFAETAIKRRQQSSKEIKERSNNTLEASQAPTSCNWSWRANTVDSVKSAIEPPATTGPARDRA